MSPDDALALADYRRVVAGHYAAARAAGSGPDAHREWIRGRDHLFSTHAQSPIPRHEREGLGGLAYWDYDPAYRVVAAVDAADHATLDISHNGAGTTRFIRIGRARFELDGGPLALDVFWLDGYGGGLFVPFRDLTNGFETYGGGRYLLDTVKGADLGTEEGRLTLDFNYAYHPSCVYSAAWSCPLAPPGNHLGLPVMAGERLRAS